MDINTTDENIAKAKKFANEFFKKLKNINDKDFDDYKYVSAALNHKFPFFATDEVGRNILHYVFMRGKVDALASKLMSREYDDNLQALRNQRDITGATPMEYIYNDRLNYQKKIKDMWFLFESFYSGEALNEKNWLKYDIIEDFYRNVDSETKDSVVRFCRTEGLLSEKECFKFFGTEATIKSYTYGKFLTKQDIIRIREVYKEFITEKYRGEHYEGYEKDPEDLKECIESHDQTFCASVNKLLNNQKKFREDANDNSNWQSAARRVREIKEGEKARETIVKQAFATCDPNFDKFLDNYKI